MALSALLARTQRCAANPKDSARRACRCLLLALEGPFPMRGADPSNQLVEQRLGHILVKPFRDRYDPSAAAGVPAHITLLYPFKHPDEVDHAALEDLRRLFHRFAPF